MALSPWPLTFAQKDGTIEIGVPDLEATARRDHEEAHYGGFDRPLTDLGFACLCFPLAQPLPRRRRIAPEAVLASFRWGASTPLSSISVYA
ncbi:MAG: hypothetical protein NTW86_24125 [Candidatus Sumerlaeota bacterium]|nr:hypothetical protein [Candidatus Sumerlaeota bacterium]